MPVWHFSLPILCQAVDGETFEESFILKCFVDTNRRGKWWAYTERGGTTTNKSGKSSEHICTRCIRSRNRGRWVCGWRRLAINDIKLHKAVLSPNFADAAFVNFSLVACMQQHPDQLSLWPSLMQPSIFALCSQRKLKYHFIWQGKPSFLEGQTLLFIAVPTSIDNTQALA